MTLFVSLLHPTPLSNLFFASLDMRYFHNNKYYFVMLACF